MQNTTIEISVGIIEVSSTSMNARYVKEIKFTTKSCTNKYEKIAVGPAIIVLTK